MPENRKMVLVVDDEPAMCHILERLLKAEGYGVLTARNGEKALELFEKHRPDLVLLDLMMPGMNGREVCRHIKSAVPETSVVYVSAKALPTDPEDLKEFKGEADAFITKPATSKQILSKVSSVLATRK